MPFGRDRAGVDCWGLLRLVYAEVYGIELPDLGHQYAGPEDHHAIRSLYEREVADWTETDDPEAGDALWLRLLGQPCHVGIYVDHRHAIHAEASTGVRIDRIDFGQWKQHGRATAYRHRLLIP